MYEERFGRFRNCDGCVLVEVGIYSGGSLRMWRWWLGKRVIIIGVDLSNRTLVYHNNPLYGSPRIFVGDQGSADLWATVHAAVPSYDVIHR